MTAASQQIDRRKAVPMREMFMQVLTSIVVGLAAGAAGVYVAVKQIELRLEYIQRDMDAFDVARTQIGENKSDMRMVKVWLQNSESRFARIENKLDGISSK